MKHALTIGINDYPGTDADLQGCVNDANDWARVLRERGFGVEMLLDAQATLAAMRSRMQATVDEANYGDTVVITYAGHGTWVPDANNDEPDGRDEALCPHDVFTKGPLTDDTLYDIFSSRARGVKLVFISDSCHSGSVARFANLGGEKGTGRVRFLAPEAFMNDQELMLARSTANRALRTLPMRSSALLLAGCQDYEYSYDAYMDGRHNGAFTRVAQDVLATLPADATYRQWMIEIRKKLPSQEYPQSPVISGTYDQRTWQIFS